MENVMLESPGEPLVVKLIDFGLSQVFAKGEKMRTACGTV
jgi:serine/threonine protein kinase